MAQCWSGVSGNTTAWWWLWWCRVGRKGAAALTELAEGLPAVVQCASREAHSGVVSLVAGLGWVFGVFGALWGPSPWPRRRLPFSLQPLWCAGAAWVRGCLRCLPSVFVSLALCPVWGLPGGYLCLPRSVPPIVLPWLENQGFQITKFSNFKLI